MIKHQERLNIIDENDNIIGEDTRENIHKKGFLHREVWIFIYNNNLEILFQKRSINKDTFPNKMDISVGGHVNLGHDYVDTAIKELKEETGITAKGEDLIFLGKLRSKKYDPVTKNTNNVLRNVFAYEFNGNLKDLKPKQDEITRFEFLPLKKLFKLTKKDKVRFTPLDWEEKIFPILNKIKNLNKRK